MVTLNKVFKSRHLVLQFWRGDRIVNWISSAFSKLETVAYHRGEWGGIFPSVEHTLVFVLERLIVPRLFLQILSQLSHPDFNVLQLCHQAVCVFIALLQIFSNFCRMKHWVHRLALEVFGGPRSESEAPRCAVWSSPPQLPLAGVEHISSSCLRSVGGSKWHRRVTQVFTSE